MSSLQQAARTALTTCLALKKNETLLIVTDDNKQTIGQALYEAGKSLSARALLVTMPPADVNGQEPPAPVAALMARYDVVVCPTTKSLTHTEARRTACKKGARVATMPGINEDIMIRTLDADYRQIASRTEAVSELLNKARLARITSEAGTDLLLPIENIRAISSTGLIPEPGQGGNLPSGESYLMPVEGKSQGRLVVDASIAGIGRITGGPVEIIIEQGYATEFKGGTQADQLFKTLSPFGQAGMNVAELGIGTNHAAKITGQILEDEKVLGTIHIAFGNNIGMGGSCDVGVHIDCVITKPTVYLDEQKIMDQGRLLV